MSSDFSKKYYANDEYKAKHNAYMSEKVACECGVITARANMSHHRKTKYHLKKMDEYNKADSIQRIKAEYEKELNFISTEYSELMRKFLKLRNKYKKLKNES